jgi:hypothetical protein
VVKLLQGSFKRYNAFVTAAAQFGCILLILSIVTLIDLFDSHQTPAFALAFEHCCGLGCLCAHCRDLLLVCFSHVDSALISKTNRFNCRQISGVMQGADGQE